MSTPTKIVFTGVLASFALLTFAASPTLAQNRAFVNARSP